jgi:hypothetical protein
VFVMAGDADRIAPADRLAGLIEASGSRAQLYIAPGISHDWKGGEADAAERVAGFLAGAVG